MNSLKLKLAPESRLAMTLALTQALEILQMPRIELAQWLRGEIEKNPLLKIPSSQSLPLPDESQLPSPPNLQAHLESQIRERFSSPIDRMIAEELLEYLDEKGFLNPPISKIASFFQKTESEIEAIFSILQTFDPPGICARNLQESLLLQLKEQNQTNTPSYFLIRDCFEDLLRGRWSVIKKKLGLENVTNSIRILSKLHMRPAELYYKFDPTPSVHPDLKIEKVERKWKVILIEEEFPSISFDPKYKNLHLDSPEERTALRTYVTSAKWLIRSLSRRRKLLKEIGKILIRKQLRYLNQKGSLESITTKELSEELAVHESTISRALAGKYAETPLGILPLRTFVSSDPSALTAKETLKKLIAEEDKSFPLTDDQLAEKLQSQGLAIARRTVTKYRKSLKIGSAAQRRE